MDFVRQNLKVTNVPERYRNEKYDALLELIEIVESEVFSKTPLFYREEVQNS